MKHKELKKDLITKDLPKNYMNLRKQYLANEVYEVQYLDNGSIKTGLKDKVNHQWVNNNIPVRPEYFGLNNMQELICCEQLRHSRQMQKINVSTHIAYMLAMQNVDVLFATFTFSNNTLNTTNETTRKKNLTRLLSKHCIDYIINIDYGKENEREHYHCVIALDSNSYKITKKTKMNFEIDLFESYKDYYYLQKIGNTKTDIKKLSSYMDKLTCHSIKIKQSYISVKKGTEYQSFIKSCRELKQNKNPNYIFSREDIKDFLFSLIDLKFNYPEQYNKIVSIFSIFEYFKLSYFD